MKKKKALAFAMALVMTLSFSGCSKDKSNNGYLEPPKGEIVDTITTDDGIEINIVKETPVDLKIGNRTYKVYEDRITYEVQKGDNIWSIARDFNLDDEDIKEFNNMDTDLIYPGDKIVITRSLFTDNINYVGIEVSEENGDINWDVTKYFTDFVLVEAVDFDYDINKFHKYIDSKGGYEKALKDPDFGKDYDEFKYELIDSKFYYNMEALEERSIPHGVIAYAYLDYDKVDTAKKEGKENANQLLAEISKYKLDYPVVLAIDDYTLGPFLHADEKFGDESDNLPDACLDYCLSFMNEIDKNGYEVLFCSNSEIYYNFVSNNHDILKYPKIITDEYDEEVKPNDITNIEKIARNESVPGLDWSKRFCPIYVDNSNTKNKNISSNGDKSKKQTKASKNSKVKKILLVGGAVIAAGSMIGVAGLSLIDKIDSELNGIPYVKKGRRNKKK